MFRAGQDIAALICRRRNSATPLVALLKRCFVLTSKNENNDSQNTSSTLPPRDEYQPVPHYRQMSALYIKPPDPNDKSSNTPNKESVFPKVLSPELNLAALFVPHQDMDKTSMSLNLIARHMHINLNKLRADYTRIRELEAEIDRLEAEKSKYTAEITALVKQAGPKNKKAVLESATVQELIRAGNEVKSRENKISEELLPLAEIVNIASLRLPNSLHYSTLLLDTISSGSTNEDRFRHVLFDMNTKHLEPLKSKMRREFDYGFDWRQLLDDSVEFDHDNGSVERRDAKYRTTTTRGTDGREVGETKWSCVKESSIESIQNNRYLVGIYAKVEHALVDYVNAKIESLNDLSTTKGRQMPSYEMVKGVSMFKSAVVEGCGDNFTNTKHIFNVVRFSGPSASPTASDIELWHLTGACSLNSLVHGFVHTSIKSSYLPWTVFTNGKAYSPDNGQINAFDLLTLSASSSSYILHNHAPISDIDSVLTRGQAYLDDIKTQLDRFDKRSDCGSSSARWSLEELRKELTPDGSLAVTKSIDQMFIDYLKLFVYIFKDFDVPMQFLCLNANQLKSSESFLIQVQAYLPSAQNYVTIGEVSLLDDYVSSRLQIRYEAPKSPKSANDTKKPATTLLVSKKSRSNSVDKEEGIEHVHMIYCRLVDINLFTQILIETSTIRKCSGESTRRPVSFVLPGPLKEFFHF